MAGDPASPARSTPRKTPQEIGGPSPANAPTSSVRPRAAGRARDPALAGGATTSEKARLFCCCLLTASLRVLLLIIKTLVFSWGLGWDDREGRRRRREVCRSAAGGDRLQPVAWYKGLLEGACGRVILQSPQGRDGWVRALSWTRVVSAMGGLFWDLD
jgi:hypothetical protein